jgi:hypothetical protein
MYFPMVEWTSLGFINGKVSRSDFNPLTRKYPISRGKTGRFLEKIDADYISVGFPLSPWRDH